jgi:hypothetical protein
VNDIGSGFNPLLLPDFGSLVAVFGFFFFFFFFFFTGSVSSHISSSSDPSK